jgi:glucose/arabinose dehydrogenase
MNAAKMSHMKYFRRGCVVSLSSALALVAGVGKADTMATAGLSGQFTVAPKVSGLNQPTSFAFLPDGRMVITDKMGDVLIADTRAGGTVTSTSTAGSFSVDTESEKGLLNVLLHPNFGSNRLLIFYVSLATSSGGTDTDRHRVMTVPLGTNDQLDMAQANTLVRGLQGPRNHDGGGLAIGPDGKLYIGVGDTGCNSNRPAEPAYTPTNFFGTCLTIPNGKILRVNLDGSIPSDNPLVNAAQVTACGSTCGMNVTGLAPATTGIRTDIWAWGFRNPWRFSFDKRTGNLWVGDVGEVTYEELDIIPPTGGGRHYGWPWREGARGNPASSCRQILPDVGDCVDPQYFCGRGGGGGGIDGNCAAIMAGAIVDSCDWPAAFQGRYFFGDHPNRWIGNVTLTANRNGLASTTRSGFVNTTGNPTHIDVGPDGALYYATMQPGTIQRVAPTNPTACPDGGAGTGGAAGTGGTAGTGGANAGGTSGAAGSGGTAGQGQGGANPGNGGTAGQGGANAGGIAGGNTGASAGTGNAGRGNAGTAGGAGTGTGGGALGGAPADASVVGIGEAGDDSSCGCRVVSNTGSNRLVLWSLAIGALALARRKRR